MGKRESPLKVCLTNGGKDTETPWAEDLGPSPSPSPSGARLVRLVNVPFLHAKPTWGDTIVVIPTDGPPVWDRDNAPFSEIDTLIHEDGGRWAMILDYVPHPDSPDTDRTYATLARACAVHDVVCEGAWGPRGGEPGRVYLAVKNELSDRAIMKRLRAAELPCELIQIHPVPSDKPAKKKASAKPAAKRPAVAAKKPAAKPAKKPAPKAAAKAIAKPAKKAAAKAVAKPVAKTAKPVSKPAAKATAKPAAKSPAKSAAGKKPAAKKSPPKKR